MGTRGEVAVALPKVSDVESLHCPRPMGSSAPGCRWQEDSERNGDYMALYLNERQVGFDVNTLGFPGIGDCMALAVQDTGGLFGFHVMPGDINKVAEFIRFMHGNTNYSGNLTHMYGCSRWTKRYSSRGGRSDWETEMTAIGRAIGYTGPVSGFDASSGTKLGPTDSLYIEFRAKGGGAVTFHYKRTSKVTAPTDRANPSSTTGDLREIDLDRAAMNAAGKRGEAYAEKYQLTTRLKYGATSSVTLTKVTRGNKGDFHEVGAKDVVTFTL